MDTGKTQAQHIIQVAQRLEGFYSQRIKQYLVLFSPIPASAVIHMNTFTEQRQKARAELLKINKMEGFYVAILTSENNSIHITQQLNPKEEQIIHQGIAYLQSTAKLHKEFIQTERAYLQTGKNRGKVILLCQQLITECERYDAIISEMNSALYPELSQVHAMLQNADRRDIQQIAKEMVVDIGLFLGVFLTLAAAQKTVESGFSTTLASNIPPFAVWASLFWQANFIIQTNLVHKTEQSVKEALGAIRNGLQSAGNILDVQLQQFGKSVELETE